ncbi:hypothetical protein QH494_20060 [Sphingomonas sp. AR_OL41]|nr:hypothetical protein [Sphingomonas sp. AR_OL41]MDH7974491.1 hypothetical protein [Sphingomonas sp. AR_OL41]
MDRDTSDAIALIDLGTASREIRGGGMEILDLVDRKQRAGLSDD